MTDAITNLDCELRHVRPHSEGATMNTKTPAAGGSRFERVVRPLALLLVCVALTACNLRMRSGEDLANATEQELAEFRHNLKYTKDPRGICYAVLANNTDGFRTTLTFAEVDCWRAGL